MKTVIRVLCIVCMPLLSFSQTANAVLENLIEFHIHDERAKEPLRAVSFILVVQNKSNDPIPDLSVANRSQMVSFIINDTIDNPLNLYNGIESPADDKSIKPGETDTFRVTWIISLSTGLIRQHGNEFDVQWIYCNMRSPKLHVNLKTEKVDSIQYRDVWLNNFDLDGDRVFDVLGFEYTGGAHCCYLISVAISSTGKKYDFPFTMDGGFVSGPDDSNPRLLSIKDSDNDGLPEILMTIDTYNGEPNGEIPQEWKNKYGISRNEIVLEWSGNEMNVHDR